MIGLHFKKNIYRIIAYFLVIITLSVSVNKIRDSFAADATDYIKWVEFNVPYNAMEKALGIDIKYHNTDTPISWIDLLACLATKYGGNWTRYKSKDMDAFKEKFLSGETPETICNNNKYFSYFQEAYNACLGGFVGTYILEMPDKNNNNILTAKTYYGLKAYSPIAEGFGYSHYDDFGNSRSYGFRRRHLGNDIIGTIGTPIIAVESGYVEVMAWNQYGGWRIGIRSLNKQRYYYYAHLRKDHPYQSTLKEGDIVKAGDVIGYLGMTGYSVKENVNNISTPHLHFGMQIIFDESQKESNNEIWIDVYKIVKLLSTHRSSVVKVPENKEYVRKYNFTDPTIPSG